MLGKEAVCTNFKVTGITRPGNRTPDLPHTERALYHCATGAGSAGVYPWPEKCMGRAGGWSSGAGTLDWSWGWVRDGDGQNSLPTPKPRRLAYPWLWLLAGVSGSYYL